MDNAIKKASKAVQRHSMYIKEVEYNEWIDDCYLLVGKAQFYKREFHEALLTFDYVAKDFKHKQIKHEALLWMARTNMELNNFGNADKFLNMLADDLKATEKGLSQAMAEQNASEQKQKENILKKTGNKTDKKKSSKNKKNTSSKSSGSDQKKKELPENHVFPQHLKADYYGVSADFYIRQENYQLAIPYLRDCISSTKKKKRRVRLLYILAQLYQKQGNYEMSTRYYSQVLKMRPSYEMEFYAQINRAMAFDVGAGNSAEIKMQLLKMMKDEKNKEFFDQIYYALADIEFKEGNEEKGIEYLKTSAEKSISNNNQKGRSYLRLAEISFSKKQYQPAQTYYDSAVSFIDKDRPDYASLVAKRNSLTKLVRNILIIEKEDSLQALAGLSEKERNKIIDDHIQKIIEEEERQKFETQQNSLMPQLNSLQQQNASAGGEWYFYNPGTIGFGFSEFKKIWGDRILEDNWRRKNKNIASTDLDGEDLVDLTETDTGKVNLKDRNYYLKNVPLDKEKMNKSVNKAIEAYYDLGLVYREQFEDIEQAKKTFEKLISKYDTCRYVLPACYQLYKIYQEERNDERAEYYKNKILKEFPSSEYAQIILNPDYFKEIINERSKAEESYKTTYRLYEEGQYSSVIAGCEAADLRFPKSHLAPKFHFLRALAIGKTAPPNEVGARDFSGLETALKDVIEKHPKDEVAAEAQKIIDLINRKEPIEQKIDSAFQLYRYMPEAKHSCVLILPMTEDANKIKIAISDFNNKYFSLAKLDISDVLLDNSQQMISVKYFNEMSSSVNYYKTFKGDVEFLKEINSKGFPLFVISYENFAIFYNDKKVQEYLSFFSKNYPVN